MSDIYGAQSPYDQNQYGATVPPIYTAPPAQLDALLGGFAPGHVTGVSIANGSHLVDLSANPVGTDGVGSPGFVAINAFGSSLWRFLSSFFNWSA